MNHLTYLLIFIFGCGLAFLINFKIALKLLRDFRPWRLLHYFAMAVMGMLLAVGYGSFAGIWLKDGFAFTSLFVSIFCALVYSLMMNNIYDKDIDEVSNIKRPLAKRSIKIKLYFVITFLPLVAAMAYALVVSIKVALFVFLFILGYFVYSVPPLRLKRVTFFSKSIIATNSILLVMAGYVFISDSLSGFPWLLIPIYIIGFTPALNFIDIKDYEGDKRAGIKTLPVVLGLEKSKKLIAIFLSSGNLLVAVILYYLFGLLASIPLVVAALIQFFIINRPKYTESPVFVVYLFTLIYILSFLRI